MLAGAVLTGAVPTGWVEPELVSCAEFCWVGCSSSVELFLTVIFVETALSEVPEVSELLDVFGSALGSWPFGFWVGLRSIPAVEAIEGVDEESPEVPDALAAEVPEVDGVVATFANSIPSKREGRHQRANRHHY